MLARARRLARAATELRTSTALTIAAAFRYDGAMIPDDELSAFAGALASAAADHPFSLAPGTFARFVACRLDPEKPVGLAITALDLADLHLACACVEGVDGAAAHFMTRFAPEIAQVAARFARSGNVGADDLVQIVVSRMLVYDGEHPPRLAQYRGVGPLGGFVRVTAARLAINVTDRKQNRVERPTAEDGLFASLLAARSSPETSAADHQARALLRAAFTRSAAQLEVRERNVLAYSLCDGLSIDAIGRMYNVHRSTAARWIEGARDALVRGTREALARELDVSETQLETFLRGGLSQFELSVTRCLRGA
ncbi:MAG: transcriptional regulator [Labilithrix sp.]|nr:transcriptional regulator [Labilithrix sp.]